MARLICDVYRPGDPFEGDSRYILKKALKEAEEMGYTFKVGPECEFFLFHMDENAMPTTLSHEQAGYFDWVLWIWGKCQKRYGADPGGYGVCCGNKPS